MKALIEVHTWYKAKYAPFIILIRFENNYITYGQDALEIAKALGAPINDGVVRLPTEKILDIVAQLNSFGIQCKLISYINQAGKHCLPEIIQLEREIKEDF